MKAFDKSPRFISAGITAALLAICAWLIAASGASAAGRNPNPGVLPANSSPYGHTLSEWGGAWWQWAYSIPLAEHPATDSTGEFATTGQSGPVWFLAGTFGGVASRTVTVPAGKGLFFPVINVAWVNVPEFGDAPWSPEQREFAFSLISPFIDNAYNLSCEVDGVSVADLTSYRRQTPVGSEYPVTVPEGNITGFLPPGTYGPTVDDGIYLMLAPLKPGSHTIRFTAASTGSILGDFSTDVTYHLTVE